MKRALYIDEEFISSKSWIAKKLPSQFELTIPIIGGIAWTLNEKEATIDTYTERGFLVPMVSFEKLKVELSMESESDISKRMDDVNKLIATSDKGKWLTSEKLDQEYFLYYFYQNRNLLVDPKEFYNKNNYLILLVKPEYANNIPPVPFGNSIPNIQINGIPYIDKNKHMPEVMNGSMSNPFRVKSIYYDESLKMV